jgi:hypothetical protein
LKASDDYVNRACTRDQTWQKVGEAFGAARVTTGRYQDFGRDFGEQSAAASKEKKGGANTITLKQVQ